MCFSKNICPVPFDQQPLNEFYALKNSCFFSFFGLKLKRYLYSLCSIASVLMLIFTPLILSDNFYSWTQFCTIESLLVTFTLTLILIRLYLGWSYIVQRLFSATIFYEESGWYDGEIWIKTPEMLTKDRLIAVYYVLPLLQRIKSTFVFLVVAIFMEALLYCLLC
uniref:Conserved hypothetical plastid protein n=1 Tax=Calliarthron tuberculosum TaxID=48942 RepID=M4IU68_CALTB|nr:conserved hypothetical plastid protein [Calliarthron tuberculosum]AGA63858.1 conserved hypothetical plastid protein [Calliarthron tuberculosum]